MKPYIIEARGRVVVNAIRTGEVSISVYSGSSGGMSAILTIAEVKELGCALIAAIRTAPERD